MYSETGILIILNKIHEKSKDGIIVFSFRIISQAFIILYVLKMKFLASIFQRFRYKFK